MTVPFSELRVAVVQQSCTAHSQANLAASIDGIRQAKAAGAQLVLLQELHTSLYFCQVEDVNCFDLAETIPGPTTIALSKLARELNIVIVASLFEKRAVGLYHNTAVVFEKNGELAGCYRKMHIPDDPGYYEKFYFAPGDLGFKPISTSVGTLGILVCWDQWYPEAARLMTLAGADCLLYPTAIGWGSQENDNKEKERQRHAWQIVQRAHAIANGLPVIVANRIGFEQQSVDAARGILFWGGSFVAGPQGELLAEASADQGAVLIADLNLSQNERVRRGWPFLRDRRIDHYQDIVQRYIDY
jgi:N-carbamoylputrescine amidase